MDDIVWRLLLQLVLIMLNAIFACAEIAVLSINDTKLVRLAANGNKKAMRLVWLTSEPAKFLATIQVAITLSGFLGSAFAAENFSELLTDWLIGLGVGFSASTLHSISVILITLLLSYITLVLGELVPKRIAMKKAEPIALNLSGLVNFISKSFSPIVWLLTHSTNGVLRLLGIDPTSDDDDVSEEEILMMVDAGRDKGVIDIEEQDFIKKIFEFDDMTVGEVSTHRTDVAVLWADETTEEWNKTILESRHSNYPVCDETVDNVIGVLNVRDYMLMDDKRTENLFMTAIKPAFFVPESIYADVLFKQMKSSRNHFSVVLDEYGGMLGVVTMNDLLELLVGDIDDGADSEDEGKDVELLDSGTWKIRGTASLDEVAEMLKVDLPLDEYETFGGYVFGSYGAIPDDGAKIELDTDVLHIKVLEIKAHRIEKALVCLIKKEAKVEDKNERKQA